MSQVAHLRAKPISCFYSATAEAIFVRLLYLIPRFPTLSETFVSQEVLGMRRLGFDITVAAFRGPTPAELAKMPGEVRELAAATHYLERWRLLPAPSRLLAARGRAARLNRRIQSEASHKGDPTLRMLRAVAVARLTDRIGAQHIHAHWPGAAVIAALAHELNGTPYSVSIHAHEVAHDNGHFPAIFETVTFASFCNRAAMEYLLSRLGSSARGRSRLIYHGVDLSEFGPVEMPPLDGPLRVVSAGRLTVTKGFHRLVSGIAEAIARGLDVSLSIVGDGPEQARIESLASDRGILERVTVTGWIPHDRMAACLADSHVFALLADANYHDGLPNVVIEAAATGRPAILSPIPAAGEFIEQGGNGWVLSGVEATGEFVEILESLRRNPGRLVSAGRAARGRAERSFDRRRELERLAGCFRGDVRVPVA